MHLEWQDLIHEKPDLEAALAALPDAIYSGKRHTKKGARGVFFCYARPAFDRERTEREEQDVWSTDAGDVKWYLVDFESEAVVEDAARIVEIIRSTPDTPRVVVLDRDRLSEVRKAVEKHIAKTYLRKVQAPVGVKPVLKAWMELN